MGKDEGKSCGWERESFQSDYETEIEKYFIKLVFFPAGINGKECNSV